MITEKDVRQVAELARIHLERDELQELTKDLESILDYVKKLEKLNTSKVEATSHVIPLKNIFREDIVKPSLTQHEALSIAVEKHHGSFKVPKVLE